MLFVMTIHFKTENVKGVAITWGLLNAIIVIAFGVWILAPVVFVGGYLVAWMVFSLSNYLEESILLRLIVLVLGMFALLNSSDWSVTIGIFVAQKLGFL